VPAKKQMPGVWVLTTEGVPQLSVAVGSVHCALAQVSTVDKTIFAGQFEKTGFTVSVTQLLVLVTRTRNEQVAVLFLVSFPV
jgi:hypothetical protein